MTPDDIANHIALMLYNKALALGNLKLVQEVDNSFSLKSSNYGISYTLAKLSMKEINDMFKPMESNP